MKAITNWEPPNTKLVNQKKPNTKNMRMYFVCRFHFTAVKNGKSSRGAISPIEPTWRLVKVHKKNQVIMIGIAIGGITKIYGTS